ncbi:MAG TPA: hypothetical protein VHE37_12010 [Nevskiaceae bacterium]|nr:hypothetical protein [Nevskiaceae bacterium]
MTHLHIKGMHGLGDNLHQRGIIRQLMQRHTVWLETPWPCVYHDLVREGLLLVATESQLRTQSKNAERERAMFHADRAPATAEQLRIFYTPQEVRAQGSVLGAMASHCGVSVDAADFRLPIPQAWHDQAAPWLARWNPSRPIAIYRPLNERTEWGGCAARNPDHGAYAQLIQSVRHDYFIVSVADFVRGEEWMVGHDIKADTECHAGELPFETLAALASNALFVFTSPGFAAILAQAVGTPLVCVFGGYESSRSFSAGAKYADYLGIDTISPCECFEHKHACEKHIDLDAVIPRLRNFLHEAAHR